MWRDLFLSSSLFFFPFFMRELHLEVVRGPFLPFSFLFFPSLGNGRATVAVPPVSSFPLFLLGACGRKNKMSFFFDVFPSPLLLLFFLFFFSFFYFRSNRCPFPFFFLVIGRLRAFPLFLFLLSFPFFRDGHQRRCLSSSLPLFFFFFFFQ